MVARRHTVKFPLVLFSVFVLALVSRSSAIGGSAPSKLVIGYAATTARLMPLWIARDQGFFTKYGIDSEPVLLRGGTTLVTGLAAGDVQIGRTAGAAVLSAVSAGHDLKMMATFSSRNSYDVVVRPNIKRVEDIRGKRIAINSLGGGTWMGVMLWLEHFGLDAQRDQVLLQSIGDQSLQAQALESGVVDVAFVDSFYSKWLKARGMTVLADYSELKQPLVSQSMIVPRLFLQQHPDIVENYLKAEVEGLAFGVAPKNKPAVVKLLMKRLRTDAAGAEDGYADLLRGVDRRPLPSLDGMRNLQRLLKSRNPKIGEVKVEDVVDGRIMRRLDESGFIDRAYAAQGARP
ncbi:MAG TPA: ABC transporter substrate-binding protein [Candidatus Binatia bacterium]|jgi:ABC-type nitrate/sulfonate/bicarbonate transport system substrate-binding protein